MSHKEHKAAEIISEDEDDERRLRICAKKYEIIVRQVYFLYFEIKLIVEVL